jgi:hypothetical protein
MFALLVAGTIARAAVSEENAVDAALAKGDLKSAAAFIQKTSYFNVWGNVLVLEEHHQMPTSLLRAALLNPRIWDQPGLEPGEAAAAREGTWDRTLVVLKQAGVNASRADLADSTARQKLAEKLK